jgi:hypothetical protein
MRLGLALLFSWAAFGAVEINYSRQDPAILKAYVNNAPASIALYDAWACNTGSTTEVFNPDQVAFLAVQSGYAVQDPEAAVYAGTTAKEHTVKYRALSIVIRGIEYGGLGVAAAASGGAVAIPMAATLGIGIASALSPRLLAEQTKAGNLTVPRRWLTLGETPRSMEPGRCEVWILAISGAKDKTFRAAVPPAVLTPLAAHTATTPRTTARDSLTQWLATHDPSSWTPNDYNSYLALLRSEALESRAHLPVQ